MNSNSVISDLHLKFAEKTWNETFHLVRRCMDKSRDESKPCQALLKSLERLQEVFNVSSMNTMKCRLETIAKQQGMGFHITEATCYLTADLFYLEVVLLPCGGVEEVKVAPHAGSPVPSEMLLQLLRAKNFSEFSMKLADLFTQYNIPGDNEIKVKLFESLQYLEEDLEQISNLPRVPLDSNPRVDGINNGRIGCLTPGKEDFPLMIHFYISPTAGAKTSDLSVQAAQVTVGVSAVTHRLQMSSVLVQPVQLDPQGCPAFLPLNEVPHETLPASFLLKLQPPMPLMPSFVKKVCQITDVLIPDVDLKWAPLPKALRALCDSALSHKEDEKDTVFTVPLPDGVTHRYILPGASWDVSSQRAAVVDSIPFTHPTHVSALLELLRHQCAINILLRTCMASQHAKPETMESSVSELHYEVLPESETSFSVTFQHPNTDSLAVLLVNIFDSHQISCTLFRAGRQDPSLDEYLSAVMKRCMSVPATLTALHRKLEELNPAPLSPCHLANTEVPNDHSALPNTAVIGPAFSQSASMPESCCSVSDSACCAQPVPKSELLPEINTDANPYPFTSVVVFPHWMTKSTQLSETV